MVGGSSGQTWYFRCALIVEPVQNLRKLVAGLTVHAGIEKIVTCATPVEAMRLIEANRCDLVLCGSSNFAGQALAQCIRWAADSPNRNVPILLLAKAADPDVIFAARDEGIDSVLAIPFSGNALATRVRSLSQARPPMVETPAYVGPERRRQDRPISFPDRRAGLAAPDVPAYTSTSEDLLREFIRSRRSTTASDGPSGTKRPGVVMTQPKGPAFKSGLKSGGKEMRCVARDLKPGDRLAKAVKSDSGLVVVGADQELTDRTILRLVDLVNAGEIQDVFHRLI